MVPRRVEAAGDGRADRLAQDHDAGLTGRPGPGAARWRVAAGVLHLRHWDGEFVVYHEATAATHWLDEARGALLSALSDASDSLDAAAVWQRAFGDSLDASRGDAAALEEWLGSLERAGLVTTDDSS